MSDFMRDRMGKVVSDLIETDPKTALILADISTAHFQGVLKNFPERAINLGIMEQTAVSLAAGLALEGFHPIVHSITPAQLPSFDPPFFTFHYSFFTAHSA